MKHQAQFLQVLICCFLLAMTLSSKTTAQAGQSPIVGTTKSNNSFLKAAFLDVNSTNAIFYGKGTGNINGGGITLISKNNWIISGRIGTATFESPQKPVNYYPYAVPIKPSSGSSGSGWFGGGIIIGYIPSSQNSSGNNGNKKSRSGSNPFNYYNMTSLSVGKIFYHPDFKSVRISLQGGVAYLNIDEAVDFIKVNTNNFGYKFKRIEYNKMGSSFRVGVEFPFSKYIGLGLTFDGTLAKQEHIFGAGISLMVGILR